MIIKRRFISNAFLYFSLLFWGKDLSALKSENLFQLSGKEYSNNDFPPAIKQALYDADRISYDNKIRIINEAILELHLKQEAKKKKSSVKKMKEELLAVSVNESDAKKWYKKNNQRLGGRDFEQVKLDLIEYLKRIKQEEKKSKIIDSLKKTGKFSLLLGTPLAPKLIIKTQGFAEKGSKNSKLTIVEFADYLCPHCKSASHSLKMIYEKYKSDIRFVFIDFPLRKGGNSTAIARAAFCSKEQGKFWEFHEEAFNKQTEFRALNPSDLKVKLMGLAKKLGLNEQKMGSCLKDENSSKQIDLARLEGERIGVQGTPAIYIDGQKHDSYEFSNLEKIIKLKIDKKKTVLKK